MSIQWISVADSLPSMALPVLIMCDTGPTMGKLTLNGWKDVAALPLTGVTHWVVVDLPA